MIIKKLALNNFRGIKAATIDMDGRVVEVRGKNGIGKTTIANAISWLLTDAPSTGEKDFSPKTADTHNLNHVAEMTIAGDDGEEVILKKDFHEVWKAKKGSRTKEFSGHTTDYYVNDVPTKEKDYKALVEDICKGNAEKINILTKVGYFAEDLKMEKRREILFSMYQNNDDDIFEEFAKIHPSIRQMLAVPGNETKLYSFDDYKAIASKRKSKLKKQLDEIPARIDELNNNCMEENVDIDTIKQTLDTLRQNLSQQEKPNAYLDVLAEKQKAFKDADKEYSASLKVQFAEYDAKMAEINSMLLKKNAEISMLEGDIANKSREATRLDKQREELLNEWNKVKAMAWNYEANAICPTCGQTLPDEKVNEAFERFNETKQAKKDKINQMGQECSNAIIQQLKAEIEIKTNNLENLKAEYTTICSEREKVKTPANIDFCDTEEGKKLVQDIREAEAVIQRNQGQQDDHTSDIKDAIAQQEELLAKAMADKQARSRIEELTDEQGKVAMMLEEAEAGLAMCDEFIKFKVDKVTGGINRCFDNIKFLLFKEQINGGIKECCEVMIPSADGTLVEYKSANTASKVNAGLEIISILAKFWSMNLPIVIDQAESVSHPKEVDQQTIRLIVDDTAQELMINKI